MKLTFICLGNICRSPMAEFVMKDLVKKANLSDEFHIQSAGTSGENDGAGVHYGTKNKLTELGISSSPFTSKKLSQKMCDESDFLITMDNANYDFVIRNFKNVSEKTLKIVKFAPNLGYSQVPDPWYSGNFDETYKIISVSCANLLEVLKKKI